MPAPQEYAAEPIQASFPEPLELEAPDVQLPRLDRRPSKDGRIALLLFNGYSHVLHLRHGRDHAQELLAGSWRIVLRSSGLCKAEAVGKGIRSIEALKLRSQSEFRQKLVLQETQCAGVIDQTVLK